MIVQTNWIERKFNFDFPLGFFPMIVERLVGTAGRMEELTKGVTGQILTRLRRLRLFLQVGITAVVVAGVILRGGFAAQVAVDALVINVELAGDVLWVAIRDVGHNQNWFK